MSSVRVAAPVVGVTSCAVGVYEAVVRPAAVVFGDGVVGHRLSGCRVPLLPLGGGVRFVVGGQQQFPTQGALSVLGAQRALRGLGQLWGFAFASPVGPVLGQVRIIG